MSGITFVLTSGGNPCRESSERAARSRPPAYTCYKKVADWPFLGRISPERNTCYKVAPRVIGRVFGCYKCNRSRKIDKKGSI